MPEVSPRAFSCVDNRQPERSKLAPASSIDVIRGLAFPINFEP
jgi:hypothetical protein